MFPGINKQICKQVTALFIYKYRVSCHFEDATVSVDLRVSRIYRHLAATPSFGGQLAGAGGTPRLSYLPFQTMELPLDGNNTVDS